jgi:acyl carrier protein
MESEKFSDLVKFTIKESCIDDEPITRETRLYDDLGIYGDDAVDFLIAYGKKFKVNVSKFMLADYFKGEGVGIFDVEPKKKTLTVGHLEKGIIAGRLDEEVINS